MTISAEHPAGGKPSLRVPHIWGCFAFALFFSYFLIFDPGLFNTDEIWAVNNLTISAALHDALSEFGRLDVPFKRPVFHAIHRTLLALLGENPPAAHFVCFVVHFLNAVLAAKFFTLLGTEPRHEKFYCLFFIATPTAAVAIPWTAVLGDLLSVLFGLIAAIVLLPRRGRKWELFWEALGIFSICLSALSKENGLVFCGIIPILRILKLADYRWRDCILIFAIGISYFVVRLIGLAAYAETTAGGYYATGFGWNIFANFFTPLFYPFALPVVEAGDFWETAAALSLRPMIAGGLLLGVCALALRNWKIWCAAIAFYFGSLALVLPLLNLSPQYFYAPGFLIAALVCYALLNGTWWQKAAAIGVIVLACFKSYNIHHFYYSSGSTQHRFYSELSFIVRDLSCGSPVLALPIKIVLPEINWWSIRRSAWSGITIDKVKLQNVSFVMPGEKWAPSSGNEVVLSVNRDGRISYRQGRALNAASCEKKK